jgi:hypothetical protein
MFVQSSPLGFERNFCLICCLCKWLPNSAFHRALRYFKSRLYITLPFTEKPLYWRFSTVDDLLAARYCYIWNSPYYSLSFSFYLEDLFCSSLKKLFIWCHLVSNPLLSFTLFHKRCASLKGLQCTRGPQTAWSRTAWSPNWLSSNPHLPCNCLSHVMSVGQYSPNKLLYVLLCCLHLNSQWPIILKQFLFFYSVACSQKPLTCRGYSRRNTVSSYGTWTILSFKMYIL